VAPLANGGRTGLQVDATQAVQPIAVAPARARLDLTVTLTQGEPIGAMLVRAGVGRADAIAAHALLRSAKLPAATPVSLTLGARAPDGSRPLQRLSMRAGLATQIGLVRDDGELRLVTQQIRIDTTPLRIRGRAGDGLYWALRSAGATPQSAAEYLRALAGEIDVGSEISPDDRFDLVIARRRAASGEEQVGQLLYAGLDRSGGTDLQLIKWAANWVDAASLDRPRASTMAWPTAGRITSGFGYRVHPILRFARLHKGVDFGAPRGTPIVAAADGVVAAAGWAGGYGRQVRLAHEGGLSTSYSHMSAILAEPGRAVRRGEVIGFVGSSGLSTGPHLHYEVYRGGVAVDPLSVRFASSALADAAQAAAIKARLKALLSVGSKA
jgi:murein DD-endopeptidase MepM/ murein hydrolase activator NlpD